MADAPLLTDLEQEAISACGHVAGMLKKIIGDGPQAEGDWREAVHVIHYLQAMIMAQAASRAYPDRYRPLGGYVEETADG